MEGKEVFLLISDRNVVETQTTSLAFTTQDELNIVLANESFGDLNEEDIEVFHGVLISPKYLPESINGCTPYIIIHNTEETNNTTCANEIFFIKGPPDVERLTNIIEGFIGKSMFTTISYQNKVKIDDIQLFFGHKIPLVFQINEDYLDEELIERVKSLSTKTEKFKTTIDKEKTNEVHNKN